MFKSEISNLNTQFTPCLLHVTSLISVQKTINLGTYLQRCLKIFAVSNFLNLDLILKNLNQKSQVINGQTEYAKKQNNVKCI